MSERKKEEKPEEKRAEAKRKKRKKEEESLLRFRQVLCPLIYTAHPWGIVLRRCRTRSILRATLDNVEAAPPFDESWNKTAANESQRMD